MSQQYDMGTEKVECLHCVADRSDNASSPILYRV